MNLNGKRALVTGSSTGLGEAIAHMLAAEGATVLVHGRDATGTTSVAAAIGERGGVADVVVGDLTRQSDAVIAAALASGPVDILVDNAGADHEYDWQTATPELWAQTYDINVISGVRMIQGFVPAMVERGWGRIVQIGGGLASQPIAMHPDYEASLAARHNLAVSLARRLGRRDEIAAAVTYLASRHADYIGGATIRVDGGTIRSAF